MNQRPIKFAEFKELILSMDTSGRRYIRRWITKWIKPDGRIEYGKRVLASGDAAKAVMAAGSQQKKNGSTVSLNRPRRLKKSMPRAFERSRPPAFNAGYAARPAHLNKLLPKDQEF